MRQGVRNSLEKEYKVKSEADFRNQIVDKLLESNAFEAPPSFVERQTHYLMMDMQRRMISGGMDRKDATELSMRLHDKLKDDAIRIVRLALLLKKIAQKESITVSDGEVEDRLKEIAVQSDQDYETVRKSLEKENAREGIAEEILDKKIIDFIADRSKVTATKTERTAQEEENR